MTKSEDLLDEMLRHQRNKLAGLARKLAFEAVETIAMRIENYRETLSADLSIRAVCDAVLKIVDEVRLEIE